MLASFFVELKLNMQTCFIHYEYFHLIPLYTSVDYRKNRTSLLYGKLKIY